MKEHSKRSENSEKPNLDNNRYYKPIPLFKKIFSTLGVFAFIATGTYFFVYMQRDFIIEPALFFVILISLLVSSFYSSLMEASYNAAFDPASKVNKKHRRMIKEHLQKRDEFGARVSGRKKTDDEMIEEARLRREESRLRATDRHRSGIDRNIYIGSYAALSVLLNTSIAVFLPWALLQGPLLNLLVIDVPTAWSIWPPSVTQFQKVDITNMTWLLLFSSTVPILLFGKIVPKIIGRNFGLACVVYLGVLSPIVKFSFGWITVGLTWFLPEEEKWS